MTQTAVAAVRPPKEGLYRADFSPGTLHLREADESEGHAPVLYGHFARFDEWVEIDSTFEGHFMERFMPGAFDKTISERAEKMRVLFNHGRDILGKQVLGDIAVLAPDDEGVYYEVGLFDGIPPLILSGLRADKYGSSHQFAIVKEEFDPRPRRSAHNPDGIAERSIVEARVYEFGPVTFPAYEGATAGVRSLTDDFHPAVERLKEDPEKLEQLVRRTGISLAGTQAADLFVEERERSRRDHRLYERCVEYVSTAAWAVHPDTLRTIVQVLGERRAGYKPSAEEIAERIGRRELEVEFEEDNTGEEAETRKGVAVIPITGAIVPHAAMLNDLSNPAGASAEGIKEDVRAAVADDNIKAVLLNIDSPGGSAALIPELASEIRAARGTKPIVAHANVFAASAAYWIASAADRIVVSPSGQVGSIGVYTIHQDWSTFDEKRGVDTTFVSAGKYKVEGNEFEPLGEEARGEMQAVVDSYYDMFVGAVADGRGVDRQKVLDDFGQGRMVMAADAVARGMADEVATFDETLQALASDGNNETQAPEPAPSADATQEADQEPEPERSVATTHSTKSRFRSEEDWQEWIARI